MRGKTRFGRWWLSSFDDAPVTVRLESGLQMTVPSIREPIALHLLTDGIYEQDVHRWIVDRLRLAGDVATLVDVGANVGAHAVSAAFELGAGLRVVAVEPSESIASYLRMNVKQNGLEAIDVVAAAAGSASGIREFYEAPGSSFGMGSFAPQFSSLPHSVEVKTLDDLLRALGVGRVDVVKVDVEGYEADVFLGAQELLARPEPPEIIFEFCDWAEERAGYRPGWAQSVLLDLGYELAKLLPDGTANGYRRDLAAVSGGAMVCARRPAGGATRLTKAQIIAE